MTTRSEFRAIVQAVFFTALGVLFLCYLVWFYLLD